MEMHERLAQEFSLRPEDVKNIMALIDGGNTIPFIARYRKEKTGSCDDQTLRRLAERLDYLRELETRREFVRQTVIGQGKAAPLWLEQLEKARKMCIRDSPGGDRQLCRALLPVKSIHERPAA